MQVDEPTEQPCAGGERVMQMMRMMVIEHRCELLIMDPSMV